MLLPIQELIAKGKFAGVAVNIHPTESNQLSVVITAKLPPMQDTAHLQKDASTKADRDAYFAVREALATPLVFTGDTDTLEADIASFIDSISDSMERASEAMKSSAVAAKLDAASTKAASTKKEKSTNKGKKADTKGKDKAPAAKKDAPEETTSSSDGTQEQSEPKSPDSFADFDSIDSI